MKWWKSAYGVTVIVAWGYAVSAQALAPDFKGVATIDCGGNASQRAVIVRLMSGNGKEELGVAIAWSDFAVMRNSGALRVTSYRSVCKLGGATAEGPCHGNPEVLFEAKPKMSGGSSWTGKVAFAKGYSSFQAIYKEPLGGQCKD